MINTAKRKAMRKQMILVRALEERLEELYHDTVVRLAEGGRPILGKSKSCWTPRGARCEANAKPFSRCVNSCERS